MINLKEVAKFKRIEPGEGVELGSAERRNVRLELNTETGTRLDIQTGPDTIRFLGVVSGRETVEFIAEGPVTLYPSSDGEVWLWTAEMESSAVVIADAETFTRIAERKPRNLELERMMAKQQENADRRMRALMQELNGALGSLRAENETLQQEVKKRGKRAAPNPPAASDAGGDDAGKPDSSAPKADDGGDDDDAAKD